MPDRVCTQLNNEANRLAETHNLRFFFNVDVRSSQSASIRATSTLAELTCDDDVGADAASVHFEHK
jgi:hypothetical protein